MIDGYYWTNNNVGGFGSDKQFGGYLTNGASRTIADTIETVWKLPSGDLIQHVYPVAFDYSGQIVLYWKFRSRNPIPVTVQVQYLLDTYIATNDQAKVLTRWGYKRRWSAYYINNTNINFNDIPPFYQAFQRDIVKKNGFDPGIVSQGTFINEDMALMPPDAVVVGDWIELSTHLWGSPPLPYEEYTDSAVLMQFSGTAGVYDKEIDLGKTAYGTGEFETCTGEIYALVYRPRVLRANATGDDYKPNPFTVDMYLFNASESTEADFTSVSLTVGPYLTIVEPKDAINNGKTQTQKTDPDVIPLSGVSVATWKVRAEKTCTGDTTWLKFYSKSTLGDPSFNDTCTLLLPLPCIDKDTMPPIADPIVINGFTKSIEFHDDRQKDKGIKQIETFGDVSHFRVTVDPFTPCTKSKVKVTVEQLDSVVSGCIDVRVTDCAGNVTNEQLCFPKYPLHPDSIAPRSRVVNRMHSFDSSLCNMKYDSVLVVDDTTYDVGLKSIAIAPNTVPVNMYLQTLPVQKGASRHSYVVTVIDSMVDGLIIVRSTDAADNFKDDTIYYCTIPDYNKPVNIVFQTSPYSWLVHTEEINPYDRKIDTVDVYNRQNVQLEYNGTPFEPTRAFTRGKERFDFTVRVVDTLKYAAFCVRSKDLADSSNTDPQTHWWSTDTCVSRDTLLDVWPPNITLTPPPYTSPTVITVNVDDIHYYNNALIGWDRGIDSIWFTNVQGFVVPATIHADCKATAPSFTVQVQDTLTIDSISTLCIHVVDCAGNQRDTCWKFPIKGDDVPPEISSLNTDRSKLKLSVTDSTAYDRGLRHVFLDEPINFDFYETWDSGGKQIVVPLSVKDIGKSATGIVRAIDVIGSQSSSNDVQTRHSASVPVSVWVQDIGFKKSVYANQDANVLIPLYFMPNDTFQVHRKGITKFDLQFDINGDLGFSYADVRPSTVNSTWSFTGSASGNRVTIIGNSISGDSLIATDSPICYVVIHCDRSESTRKAILDPVDRPLGSVIYNDNQDRVVIGQNAKVTLPAPFGSLSGASIVAVGSCAPSIQTGGMPTVVSLDPNTPNPFRQSTRLAFTVPKEDMVQLIIYNSLGKEIARLVNGTMKPGAYSVTFNAQGLPAGTYYARLEANREIVTRQLLLRK